MIIRKATPQDSAQLTKLRTDMRSERENQPSQEHLQRFLDNTASFFLTEMESGRFVAFVAEEEGKIVATSGLSLYSVPPTFHHPTGRVGYLMNMYTAPEYRKRGLATLLLQTIMEYAKSSGCTKVTLDTSDMGRPLYEKYGFADLDHQMVYHING